MCIISNCPTKKLCIYQLWRYLILLNLYSPITHCLQSDSPLIVMLHFKIWHEAIELNANLSHAVLKIKKFSCTSDNNHLFLLMANRDLLHAEFVKGSQDVCFKKLYHNVLDVACLSSRIFLVSANGRLFESELSALSCFNEVNLRRDDEEILIKAVSCGRAMDVNALYVVDNSNRLWVKDDENFYQVEFFKENGNSFRPDRNGQTRQSITISSGIDFSVMIVGVSDLLNGIENHFYESSSVDSGTLLFHSGSCRCVSNIELGKEDHCDNENSIARCSPTVNENRLCEGGHIDVEGLIECSENICSSRNLLGKSAVHEGRLLLDTEVWACGHNRRGQLGVGDQVPRKHGAVCIRQLKRRALKHIASGNGHSVALAIDGQAWGWGEGSAGQLGNLRGLGDEAFRSSSSPRVIHWPISIGKVVDIAAGDSHSVLLTDSGTIITLGKCVSKSSSSTSEVRVSPDDLEPVQIFASGNFTACICSSVSLKKTWPKLSELIRDSMELLSQSLSFDNDLFPLTPSSPLNKTKKDENLDEELDLVMQAVTEGHHRILSLVTLAVESLVWCKRDLHMGKEFRFECVAPISHSTEYVKVYRAYLEAVCDLLAMEGFKNVQHYSCVSIQHLKTLFPDESDDKIVANALFKPLDHQKFYLRLIETFYCSEADGSKDCVCMNQNIPHCKQVFPQGKTSSVPELTSFSHPSDSQMLKSSFSETASLHGTMACSATDMGSSKGSLRDGSVESVSSRCVHGALMSESITTAKRAWRSLNAGDEWIQARTRAEETRHFWEDPSRGGVVLDKWRVDKSVNKKCSWQPRIHTQRLIRESRPVKPRDIPSLWVARPGTLFTSAAYASSFPSSSSPSFVLLTDAFLQITPNGSTTPHNLSTLWVEFLKDSWEQDQGPLSPQNALQLIMPEESLTLVASCAEARLKWLKVLQSAIMKCLSKESPALLKTSLDAPPASRNASHLYLHHAMYKNAVYTGGWFIGRPNGKGVMEWSDGRKIEGIFKDGQVNGHALHTHPDVGNYDGQWKDGLYHGFGIMRYANGAVYEGEWRCGLPEGHGIRKEGHFLSSVASVYVGDWLAGLRHGYGVMDDILTGQKYLGMWERGEKNGSGLIVSLDGIYHEGTFVRGSILGHGVMVFEEGTHYEGELKGIGVFGGRGKLTLAPGGHSLEGVLSGSWDKGVRINHGTFHFKRPPTSPVERLSSSSSSSTPGHFGKLCVLPLKKWKSLFQLCREELGLKPEDDDDISGSGVKFNALDAYGNVEKSLVDVQKVWENVAVAITRSQLRLKQKLQQQPLEKQSKIDDCVFKSGDDGLITIPLFGRKFLDKKAYEDVQNYLMKATESKHHPIGRLVASLASAFNATYGGVRVHPLLLPHAVSELTSLTVRLYAICRLLFPALPSHEKEVILYSPQFAPRDSDIQSMDSETEDLTDEDECRVVEEEEQVVTSAGLLHPILLPRVHSSLFVLYALHNKAEDDSYWHRLLKWNSHDNLSLMAFLEVHRKFWVCASPLQGQENDIPRRSSVSSASSTPTKSLSQNGHAFVDAVETLQQLKTTFCPLEKLEVIHKTFEKMARTIQKVMDSDFLLGMDDLFPVFLFIVVRSQILQLGSEIHFIEDFMESHLRNGELGMMFTTLKACYYQILQEKLINW